MRMSERARAHVHGDSGRSKPPVGSVLFLLDPGVRFRKLDLFGHDLILQFACTDLSGGTRPRLVPPFAVL